MDDFARNALEAEVRAPRVEEMVQRFEQLRDLWTGEPLPPGIRQREEMVRGMGDATRAALRRARR